jgi:hypothetical protein
VEIRYEHGRNEALLARHPTSKNGAELLYRDSGVTRFRSPPISIPAKATSLERANEYCTSRGKQMHQVDMQTHGVRGWTPQEAELTFSCLQVE